MTVEKIAAPFDPLTFSVRHAAIIVAEVEGYLLSGDVAHALSLMAHSLSRPLAAVAAHHAFHRDAEVMLNALATYRAAVTDLALRMRPGPALALQSGFGLNRQDLLNLAESNPDIHIDLGRFGQLRAFLTAWGNNEPGPRKLTDLAALIGAAAQAIRVVTPASAKPRNLSAVA